MINKQKLAVIAIDYKELIKDYISQIKGQLFEEAKNPNWEFGIRFKYPNKNGRIFLVVKPKGTTFFEISNGTRLDPPHQEAFNKLSNIEKKEFIKRLGRMIIVRNFEHAININPNKSVFVLIDRIFLENKTISLNLFYKSIKSMFFCTLDCVRFIQERFGADYDPNKDGFDASNFEPYMD